MKWFSSFRARLFLTIFPVVAGVTIVSLWFAERRFSASQQHLFEEQFDAQIAIFDKSREKRFEALSSRLEEIAKDPKLVSAVKGGTAPAARAIIEPVLQELGRQRLESESPQTPAGRFQKAPRPDDRRLPGGLTGPGVGAMTAFVALVDADGKVLGGQTPRGDLKASTKDSANSLRKRSEQFLQLKNLRLEEVLKVQQVGYKLIDEVSERRDQIREIFVTPIRDTDDAFLGALIFGLPLPSVSEKLLYEQSRRMDQGAIMSGIMAEQEIVSTTIPEAKRSEVVQIVTDTMEHSRREHRELIATIDGVRHRIIYRVLNPNSPFQNAVQINLFSLANIDAEISALRIIAAEIVFVALLVSAALILFISRGLSGPVNDLVKGTHEIEQGNFDYRVPVRSKDEVGRLAASFNHMAAGLALQEKYRSVLNAVADRTVAERLMGDSGALEGEIRDVSTLFCDIRGFTALSERLAPTEVIELLNEHMTAMTEVAYRHGGIVDKFVGDLIMVLFGAPISHGDDAQRAVACAAEMHAVRHALNAHTSMPLEVGIGIATGSVVAGCMGSEQRLSYTVVGSRVNLASRLCSVAQAGQIVIDDHTRHLLPEDIECEALQPLQLKGIAEPVNCWRMSANLPDIDCPPAV